MAETAKPINPAATHNVPEYTVSEIAGAVKRMVEERFGRVRVRGEISQWKVHGPSGHAYFRLKDESAVLDGVCWRGTVDKLPFRPEDGLEVIITGKISTYPGKSSYQIVVERMEPSGAGALMALLEKRRAMLAAEGLFDASRKKPLPFLPEVIGVVTSPSGAVIRDIIHRIADRFPLRILVWPVAVQGESAASQVAEAIAGFNTIPAGGVVPRPDLLIVARGGGSLEDLWAFNEEIVVRATAASAIPLISAVGHETDTTLIDFVSDRRAPTPTAAAEIAVPVLEELRTAAAQLAYRQQNGITRLLHYRQEKLQGLVRGLPQPATLLAHAIQRLDDWRERLAASLPALLSRKGQLLSTLSAALRPQLLMKDLETGRQRASQFAERLSAAALRRISTQEERLQSLGKLLGSLNYQSVLKRGFALVAGADGALVTSAKKASKAASLTLTFHDGEVKAKPV